MFNSRFAEALVVMSLCFVPPVNAADLTVSVDATAYIRVIPQTMYGTNMQCWDGIKTAAMKMSTL